MTAVPADARVASKVRFSIARWSICAPAEGDSPSRPPDLPELPMMLRRRASVADRLALRAAFDCAPEPGPLPAVFCSRMGEVRRSVEMLEALSRGEPLSPMTFGLSVHNAAAALFSIARGDAAPACALAAGPDSLPSGVVEACGMLEAGAPRALLVAYDDRLPREFESFAPDGDRPAALALLLEPAGETAWSLALGPSRSSGSSGPGPQILRVARFLESAAAELEIVEGPRRWLWRRDD